MGCGHWRREAAVSVGQWGQEAAGSGHYNGHGGGWPYFNLFSEDGTRNYCYRGDRGLKIGIGG